jgi:FkbM family methyltransferase
MKFSAENIIDTEIADYEKSFNIKVHHSTFVKFLNKIARSNSFFLSPFKRLINNYNHYKSIKGYYKVTPSNRMFSLEFIKYLLAHGDGFIPESYTFYNDVESKDTLSKLYRNKTLCATYNFIKSSYIFSDSDIKKIEEYKNLKIENIKESKKSVEVFGYSFLKPFIFEPSVFIGKIALNYLSEKTIKHFRNKDLIIIDCGAYTGDSAFVLNEFFPDNPIFAFEMSPENFNYLNSNIKKNKFADIIFPYDLAVGNSNTLVSTSIDSGIMAKISHKVNNADNVIKMVKLDSFIKEKKVALIKMDIEGAEIDAIKGAYGIIKKNSPILIIALYHKTEDLVLIPKMIDDLKLGYSFRLRHVKPESPAVDYMLICEPPI